MKNKLTALLLFLSLGLAARRNDSIPHSYVSFGIKVAKDLGTEYYYPVRNALVVQADPLPFLRADLSFGVNNYRTRFQLNNASYDLRFNSKQYSAGVYGVLKQERMKAYLGYRFTVTDFTADWLFPELDSTGTMKFGVKTDKGKLSGHSAVLGGEYFIGDNFSLGAEFSFTFASGKIDLAELPASYIAPKEFRVANSSTEGSLILRFYFLRKKD